MLGGCGARTPLDEPGPVDAATVDVNAVILDASAADVGELDGPQLIGPDADRGGDAEVAHDADITPDACINPYDRDSGAMCVTMADCCQVAIGTSCMGGRCIPDHQQ